MRASLYRRFADNAPTAWSGTWDELCRDVIGAHQAYGGPKDQSPSWGPYALKDGATRGDANVVDLHCAVIDVDDAQRLDPVRAWIKEQGACALIHSTYSGTGYRVVMPLKEPCPAAEWQQVWRALAFRISALGIKCDPSCKDRSRLYARPFVPAPASAIYERYEGAALDWRALLTAPAAAPADTVAPWSDFVPSDNAHTIVDPQALRSLAPSLKKGKSTREVKLRTYVDAILNGQALATPGGRHDAYLVVSSYLDEQFPDGTLDSITELLHFTFTAHANEGGTTAEEDRADFRRALEGARARRLDAVACRRQAREQDIAHAIAAVCPDRTAPYTYADLERHATMDGLTVDAMRRRWILAWKRTVAIRLDNGSYSAFYDSEGLHGLVQQYNPALYHGDVISFVRFDEAGIPRKRSPRDILDEHATALQGIEYDIRRDARPHYSTVTSILTMPACHRRSITPEYNADIDAWLRYLAGARYADLDFWLIHLDNLQRPLPILAITGPGDIGKTLFVEGIAQLYEASRPWRSCDDIDDPFKERALATPIDWCEERLPKCWCGKNGEAALRDAISMTSMRYRAMYSPPGGVIGHRRIVITANHTDLIATVEERTQAETDAVTARILGLDFDDDDPRVDEINAVLDRNREADGRITKWVAGQAIARHVAWLARADREDAPSGVGRFGIEAKASRITRAVGAANRARQNLVTWINQLFTWAEYSASPNSAGSSPPNFDRVRRALSVAFVNGRYEILIHTSALDDHELWAQCCGPAAQPTMRAKQLALSGLSIAWRSNTMRWRLLDREKLYDCMSGLDWTPGEVDAKIAAVTERLGGAAVTEEQLPLNVETALQATETQKKEDLPWMKN